MKSLMIGYEQTLKSVSPEILYNFLRLRRAYAVSAQPKKFCD